MAICMQEKSLYSGYSGSKPSHMMKMVMILTKNRKHRAVIVELVAIVVVEV